MLSRMVCRDNHGNRALKGMYVTGKEVWKKKVSTEMLSGFAGENTSC